VINGKRRIGKEKSENACVATAWFLTRILTRLAEIMLRRGKRRIPLADHSMVEAKAHVLYGRLTDFDLWYTTPPSMPRRSASTASRRPYASSISGFVSRRLQPSFLNSREASGTMDVRKKKVLAFYLRMDVTFKNLGGYVHFW